MRKSVLACTSAVSGLPSGSPTVAGALHGRAGGGAFDADHPGGSELIVAADLAADHDAASATGLTVVMPVVVPAPQERILHQLHRIGNVLVGKAAADMAAEIAAGPGEARRERRRRLERQIRGDARVPPWSLPALRPVRKDSFLIGQSPCAGEPAYMANQAWRNRVLLSWAPIVVPLNLL